ncbi:MAG TPA: response regulator transcription factor [Chthoniobacteraceae bacterium]|nr:response regulator transcription factor [Chthoniobacteraceae bacterium]
MISTAPPAEVKTVRILVADDQDLICAGLELILGRQSDMEVCATARSGREALEKAIRLQPDVAVLDVEMAGMNGMECTRAIRKAIPACEVMLFTGMETDDLMREAFLCGAKSFILKSDAKTHLLDAIRALAQHKPYFTTKVSEVIFSRLLRPARARAAESESTGRLTPHEEEIVRRLALGDGNRELAEKLGVNLRTAEGQRAALMKKMKFESLADLVRYAARNGIIEV